MTNESANAQTLSGGTIGNTVATNENANAQGVYHAVCCGYKEEHKDEYLSLWAKAQILRDKIGDAISKELADLEAYMESLTEVKWDEYAHNVVCTVGKNLALDTFLAGSGYTVTGPYMGLIGAVGYTGVPVAGDTMASHGTWTEAGATNAPTYTAPRKTIAWSAASAGSKSPSAAPVYAITGSGTVKGVFLCFGSGAVSTIDSTAGTLWSAGLFSGGDQAVVNTNTITISYSTSL